MNQPLYGGGTPAAPNPPAAAQGTDPAVIYLRNVRLSHPALDAPQSFRDQPNQPKKYGASFIFGLDELLGQENMQAVVAAANAVKIATWPKSIVQNPDGTQSSNMYLPEHRKFLRDGNTVLTMAGQQRPECIGKWYITAKSDDAPMLYDRERSLVPPNLVRRVFYSGCRVDAYIRLFPVVDAAKGGNGLFAGLNAVRFRDNDAAFGAAPVAGEAFEELPPLPEQQFGMNPPGAAQGDPLGPGAPGTMPPPGGNLQNFV